MAGGVVVLPEALRGRWVAYRLDKGVRVIDCDEDFWGLLERLRRRGVDARFVQIDYVPGEDVVFIV